MRSLNPDRQEGLSVSAVSAIRITAFFALAIAHPLYQVLGQDDHVPFFVAHQAAAIDIWLLVLAISFALPLSLFAALWMLERVSRPVANGAHLTLVVGLLLVLFLQVWERILPEADPLDLFAAVLTSAALGLLYARSASARTLVTLMSPVIVLSPVLFLTSAPIGSLLSPANVQEQRVASTSGERPSAVMIVFDELPLISLLDANREIDAVRFPNFYDLAQSSIWYRNASAVHFNSFAALPATLIGSNLWSYFETFDLESVPGSLDRRRLPHNVFSLLEDTHEIFALETLTKLAPVNQEVAEYISPLPTRLADLALDVLVLAGHVLLPSELRDRLPLIYGQWRDFVTSPRGEPVAESEWPYPERKLEEVHDFIQLLQTRNRPAFYFAHFMMPHFPFIYDEAGRRAFRDRFRIPDDQFRRATGVNNWPDEVTANLAWQAHLLQLSFTDLLLGLITDRLRELDLFDDALIVVTSDHGMSFYFDTVGLEPAELSKIQASETLYVPLIVKAPGQRAASIEDKLVETIDILPTIADILEIDPPFEVEGVSGLAENPPGRLRSAYLTEVRTDKRAFDATVDPSFAALARKLELFDSHDFDSLYAAGRHKAIIGREVGSFAIEPRPGVKSNYTPKSFLAKPEARDVSAYVEGKIEGPELSIESTPVLVIAINGTIRATTLLTEHDNGLHFLARIPFVAGINRVALYGIVEDESGSPESLVELTGDGSKR